MTARDRLLYEMPANVVVVAGAGTGKTHRLTGLYVHLVGGLTDLGPPLRPDAIVATTFTREAASEMRARIEARLRRLAETPLAVLRDDPSCAAWADELAETCARRAVSPPPIDVWRRALEGLASGTITTFHAWAGEIVRAHAIEADAAPGFALLEPEDADVLVLDALHATLARWADDASAPCDGAPTRAQVAQWLVAGGIERLEEALLRARMRATEEGVDAGALVLADGLDDVTRAEASVVALTRALDEACRRAPPKAREPLEALRALGPPPLDDAAAAERWSEAAIALYGCCATADRNAIKELLESSGFDTGALAARVAGLVDEPATTRHARRTSAAVRSLLEEIEAVVVDVKRRRRVLDFGDVMRKARDLLRDHPEVQESIALGVSALLVDEFQDTNALQRDLVYLVRQEPDAIRARSAGVLASATTLQPRGLFVVGDRKQSIYSFRGADVAVFQRIALEIAGEQARRALGIPASVVADGPARGHLVTLDENRRSLGPILSFVNAVAARDMRGHAELDAVADVVFQPDAEGLRPVRQAPNESPRVVFPTIAALEGAPEVSRNLAAALALAAELRRVLDDPSAHGLDGLRARDVAILIQTYAILPSLELALACHGVEYAIAAPRGLYATAEAADLEALVRLSLDARDRNALLAVLRGPYVALGDTALFAMSGEHGLELGGELPPGPTPTADERARLHTLREALADLAGHGHRLGAADALRRALDHLGVERTLALLPRGEQRIGDLRRLLEIADVVEGGLVGFARRLAAGRRGATAIASSRKVDDARGAVFDRQDDVVRIMTVHGSKGLEFRAVAVMQLEHIGRNGESAAVLVDRDADGSLAIAVRAERGVRSAFGRGGRRLVDRAIGAQRAERQRLTYVALTRARDRLWVVAGPQSKAPQSHTALASMNDLPWAAHPELAARPAWTATAASPPAPEPPPFDTPPPRWGTGPIPITERAAPVVTTALTEFALCPRRFRLLHLVGLGENPPWTPKLPSFEPAGTVGPQLGLFALDPSDASGARAEGDGDEDMLDVDALEAGPVLDADAPLPVTPPPLDPRARGIVAHLALERAPIPEATGAGADAYARAFLRGEGFDPQTEPGRALTERIARFLASPYARSLGDPGVEVQREVAFLVELPGGAALRGTIDLLVVRRSGPRVRVEIVDYKLRAGSAADLGHYALQLRAYVAAVALSAAHADAEIVAGIAFLGRGDGQPLWLDDGPDRSGRSAIARIDEVARGLLRARATNVWPGIDRKRCQAIGCGFRKLCWPPRRDVAAAAPHGLEPLPPEP